MHTSVCVCLFVCCITGVVALDEDTVLNRLNALEVQLAEVRHREQKLENEVRELRTTVNLQAERITKLESKEQDTAPDQQHSYKSKGNAQHTGKQDPTEMVTVRESNNDTAKGPLQSKRQTKIYSVPEVPVAFSAFKQNNLGSVNAKQNIVFDFTHVNEGNGYHTHHGLFIAPNSGIYFFTVSLLHTNQSQYAHVAICLNGNVVARLKGDLQQYEQTSQSVILSLNAGDEVYVRNDDFDNMNYFYQMYSSFSGFLLWSA